MNIVTITINVLANAIVFLRIVSIIIYCLCYKYNVFSSIFLSRIRKICCAYVFLYFSLPSHFFSLPLPMVTNGESIRSVGHRLIVRQYCRAFFMPSLYRIGGCHSVNEISPTGEVVICNQRDVQPLSVSPYRRFRRWLQMMQLCKNKKFPSAGQ